MKKILIILPLLAVLSVPINASSYCIARVVSRLTNQAVCRYRVSCHSLKKVARIQPPKKALVLYENVAPKQNYMKTALLWVKGFKQQPKHITQRLVFLLPDIALRQPYWFGIPVRETTRHALVGNLVGYKYMVKFGLYGYAGINFLKTVI